MTVRGAVVGPVDPVAGGDRFYLRQFDLFRVVACAGVVAQHSILWPVTGSSVAGWGAVMMLHATREVFFVLSTFVACYSQLLRPRSLPQFWYRRFSQILVPYLVWTLIYFIYTVIDQPMGWSMSMSTLRGDLWNGYYQLYFLVVLFQIYAVLPALMWLVRVTRGHHFWVFGISLAFQIVMMTMSHYFSWHSGALGTIRHYNLDLMQSRRITGYVVYVVAGALAADHFGEMQRFVERHTRRILAVVAGIGLATLGDYFIGIAIGQTPGHASDLYQPVAVLWFLAAALGLTALGCVWARRAATRPSTGWDRFVTWGSDASGGFYLAHVLILQLIVSGLAMAGLKAPTHWAAVSVVLYVSTLVATGILVAILLRTPLRFILTGPNRTDERASFEWYPQQMPLPSAEQWSPGAVAPEGRVGSTDSFPVAIRSTVQPSP